MFLNLDNNTGHLFDFFDRLLGSLSFSSKCATIEHYFDFFPDNLVCFYIKNPPKVIFYQIAPTEHIIDVFA